MTTSVAADDRGFLVRAIALSRLCPPSQTAFSVGALLVRDGVVIATGYSREEGPTDHAEEVAIRRARAAGEASAGCTLYSSLEPCAQRKSGRRPCCDHIVEAGIARVVFASEEPATFVAGRGAARLRAAGLAVHQIADLAAAVRQVNAHLPWEPQES